MPVDVTKIKSLLGDRILIKPLSRPQKRGGLMLPVSALKDKGKQTDLWFGAIENLGKSARYPDAFGLEVGDIVGVEFIGKQCETLIDSNGDEHCWVAEEFIAFKDSGRVKAFYESREWDFATPGIIPLNDYVLVRPEPVEEMRGGIHIPHSSQEQQKHGECLAVSAGKLCGDSLQADGFIVPGDRLLYGRFSGAFAKLDEELLLMKQEDVVAVMDPVSCPKEEAHV